MVGAVSKALESDLNVGFVVAEFGSLQFGIPTLEIRDVVQMAKLAKVPLAPSYVRGISNMRGRIVTVIDAAELLGLQSLNPHRCVTCSIGGDLCGLLVDAVDRVISVNPIACDPVPFTVSRRIRQVSSGIVKEAGNLVILLDIRKMLATLEPSRSEDEPH